VSPEIDIPQLGIRGKDGSLFFINRMTDEQKSALDNATNPFSEKKEESK
jgi:hypothetical protein